jgi:predicted metal-dependent peptidase
MQVAPRKKPVPVDPALIAKLDKRLSKAKTGLILDHPFIGTIAIGMPFYLDDSIPTAATNGKRVLFNPRFVDSLDDDELTFLVAHECFHPMLEHNYRRGMRNAYKWNKAADYIINQHLTEERIGRMPKTGLYDPAIYSKGKGTSEGVYNLLPDEPDGPGGFGGQGQPLDDCEDAEGTPAEVTQEAAEWRVRVAQAAQAAKMMGKMSAGLERLVGEILQPKVDWREVMQKFFERVKNDTRSYARFNRRFLSQGLYLPSISGEALGEVVFAIDCSGSIGERELTQFASEVRVVKDDLQPVKLHVIYFDSEVSHYECYEGDDSLNIKAHGGGGTAFSPVFRYIEQQGITPVACVFLTDLCCSDFGPEPDYPVLWVSNYSDKAPFGEVVMMENE